MLTLPVKGRTVKHRKTKTQKEVEGTGMSPSIRSIFSSTQQTAPPVQMKMVERRVFSSDTQRSLALHAPAVLEMHGRLGQNNFDKETRITEMAHLNYPRCAAGKWKGRIVSEL